MVSYACIIILFGVICPILILDDKVSHAYIKYQMIWYMPYASKMILNDMVLYAYIIILDDMVRL